MHSSANSPAGGTRSARILIIDDHEVFRAACRALLRTEGLDVVADVAAGDRALPAARALRPEVAIVDVTPAASTGFGIAGGLLALPAPPIVILTSSTDRTKFGAELNGYRFIAKAGICAAAITRLATTPAPPGSELPNPGTPATRPANGTSALPLSERGTAATIPDWPIEGIARITDDLRAAFTRMATGE